MALKKDDTVYRESDPTRIGTIKRIFTDHGVRKAEVAYSIREGEKKEVWSLNDCILAD
jgi:hypothetical protein